MFTKLYPENEIHQITFFNEEDDSELRSLMGNVTSMTQDSFRDAAFKLFQFASRLGLDDCKLATSLKMNNQSRHITIQRVPYNQYKIVYKVGSEVDFIRFNGTERALKKKLRTMKRNGMRPVGTELEIELGSGYKFGSESERGENPYTFGVVWSNRIEGKPHLITRMLRTLFQYEQAINSAKDDLLEQLISKQEFVPTAA